MKIKTLISVVCLSVFTFSANAATLIPAKGVSILYVNGVESESKQTKRTVDSGETQLVLRMEKTIGRSSGNNHFTSDPYVVTIDVSGEEVKIKHPVARSKTEAEKAFKSETPQWTITQDGKNLEYAQQKLEGNDGMFPYVGMEKLLIEHNRVNGVRFDSGELVQAAPLAEPVVVETKAVQSPSSMNVEQLKAWYSKASKQERKEFRKWMIDQE